MTVRLYLLGLIPYLGAAIGGWFGWPLSDGRAFHIRTLYICGTGLVGYLIGYTVSYSIGYYIAKRGKLSPQEERLAKHHIFKESLLSLPILKESVGHMSGNVMSIEGGMKYVRRYHPSVLERQPEIRGFYIYVGSDYEADYWLYQYSKGSFGEHIYYRGAGFLNQFDPRQDG